MGTTYGLHCKKCGYTTSIDLGVGFAYPIVYSETQEKGKRGDLGTDIKQFFADHPDGAINPCLIIALCEKCGEYDSVEALTMYVPDETKRPKKKSNPGWSVARPLYNSDYVLPGEFKKRYKLYKEYVHKC